MMKLEVGSHGTVLVPWALASVGEPKALKARRGSPLTKILFRDEQSLIANHLVSFHLTSSGDEANCIHEGAGKVFSLMCSVE